MPRSHAAPAALPERRRPAPAASRDRVVVGLSGGVDSAVAAWLLKQQGYDVVGLFMKNWEDDDDSDTAPPGRTGSMQPASPTSSASTSRRSTSPTEYKDRVFAEFLREYSAGRTPNPDVLCNAEIKFKAFLDHALRLGAARIATGHYAGVRRAEDGSWQLLRGVDPGKDQSYFLHRLDQQQLARAHLSAGRAAQVGGQADRGRDRPAQRGQEGFDRHLLHRRAAVPRVPGAVPADAARADPATTRGTVVGEHVGLAFYTLGPAQGHRHRRAARQQRRSPGTWRARTSRATRCMSCRAMTIPGCCRGRCAARTSTGSAPRPQPGRRYGVKTRYRQSDAPAQVDAGGVGQVRIDFEAPQWAVTPGQSAVVYDGEVCLGGGVIATMPVHTSDVPALVAPAT